MPQRREPRKQPKPALPKGKFVETYEKEKAYFEEVDSFELLEESPSPKNFGTWTMGTQNEKVEVPNICSRLEKWLISRRIKCSFGASDSLFRILETPKSHDSSVCSSNWRTPEKASLQIHSGLDSVQSSPCLDVINKDEPESRTSLREIIEEPVTIEDVELSLEKLSLTSQSASLGGDHSDPFSELLTACGQSSPSVLLDVFSNYCEPGDIVKVGEGTYGEAFKAGNTVCKIVPVDGALPVNGEVQKRSEELLEEVTLCLTLNRLRGHEGDTYNTCSTFIETKDIRVCQGPYDSALIKAWEDWDAKHSSENDHPKEFPDNQCYVVFVLEHGGRDLESFVLLNFDEARSLLVQVTAALAVAEAAYEFEHRDLHWGNILLSRKDSPMIKYTLQGKQIFVRTYGLLISIIDFTLSRLNAGETILFFDLTMDPAIFEGPKGDKQSDTYRKMKDVTEECWEGSFPKTNVLWLQYLVDILLLKKSFKRNAKDERDMRSLKKRLSTYSSAKEAISDCFFENLFVDDAET